MLTVVFAMLLKTYLVERMNHEDVVASEIRAQRRAEEERKTRFEIDKVVLIGSR